MGQAHLGTVSYNLWRENTPENVTDDVVYLFDRPDVDLICFQEGARWYGLIRRLVEKTCGAWEMAEFAGDTRGSRQNIVLWRTSRLRLKRLRFIDLPSSKGGLSDRWLVRCDFEVVGLDEECTLFATHLHSHVQNRSWWRLPRQLDYRRDLRVITRHCARVAKRRAVLAAGDWNVDQKSKVASRVPFFPKQMFAKINMSSNWTSLGFTTRPTKGRRYIDAIFLRATQWLQFGRQQVIRLSSDHRALLVRFAIATR